MTGENVWYGDADFGLSGNGSWNNFAWVGGYCWSGDCTATINLGGLYSSVGGFMNYLPGGDPVIAAIASDGTTVLESYDLATAAPISTPGGLNDGAFRGISRATADIAYFRLSGSYLIEHDITLSSNGSATPEPGTLGLMVSAAMLAGVGFRRKLGIGSRH